MRNLKRLRVQRGLTQEELAELAKVSLDTVARLERMAPSAPLPRPGTVRKLAEALEVEPLELWGEDATARDRQAASQAKEGR